MTYNPREYGAHCDVCPNRSKTAVPPSTTSELALIVVGEGPDRVAELAGTPLAGQVESFLLQTLRDAKGPGRTRLHVTNAILCRGEDNETDKRAAECCAPRLLQELAALDKNVTILTLGALASKSVLNAPGILKSRGFVWTTPHIDASKVAASARAAGRLEVGTRERGVASLKAETLAGRASIAGRRVHPTLHPSFILKADLWKSIFAIDVERAVEALPARLDSDVSGYVTGVPEILALVTGDEVSVDIETDGLDPLTTRITCVGVSDGENTVVLYPWEDSFSSPLVQFLETKKTRVLQNGFSFDTIALNEHSANLLEMRVDDTMLHHHTYYSHWPHNLGQIVTELCVSEPWKLLAKGQQDEKGSAPSKMSGAELCKYNAQDAKLTILRWKRRTKNEADERVYEHDLRLARVCRAMIMRGMPVDLSRLTEVQTALEDTLGGLAFALRRTLAWGAFNPRKNADVQVALYDRAYLGSNVTRRTPKGHPSTDKAVIEVHRGVEGRVGEFATLLTRYRLVGKILSTYVMPERTDVKGKRKGVPLSVKTGRVHYNWKQLTVTGRLNCRAQSIPRFAPFDRKTKEATPEGRVREFYSAPLGKRLVYFDASQIQMRIAAYLSQDAEFIKACLGDVHSNNAAILFPDKAALGWFSEEGKKDVARGKPFRDITKNCGFAVTFVAEDETVFLYLRAHGFPVQLPFVVRALSNLRARYRHYFRWVTANHERVRKTGYMRTPVLGRIIWLGWNPKITEVAADIIQGAEADILTQRMIEVEEKHSAWMPIVAQIHDACIYEVDVRDVERAKDVLREMWVRPVEALNGCVLPIDLKDGQRWSEFG